MLKNKLVKFASSKETFHSEVCYRNDQLKCYSSMEKEIHMMQNLSFHVEHPQEANPIKQLHSLWKETAFLSQIHTNQWKHIFFTMWCVYYSCVQKFYPSYSAAARPQIRWRKGFYGAKRYLKLNSYGITCIVGNIVSCLPLSRHLSASFLTSQGNCKQIQSNNDSKSFAKSSRYQSNNFGIANLVVEMPTDACK